MSLEAKHGDFGLSAILTVLVGTAEMIDAASSSTNTLIRARPDPQMQLTGAYVANGSRSFVRRRGSRYVQHRFASDRVAGS